MMRKEGPQKRIFDELQKIQETKFRFSPEPSPGDNVENLSESMQKYPPEHYITGSDLFYKYDPEGITDCLSLIRHDNVNIMVLSNDNSTNYNLTEPWFKTPYAVKGRFYIVILLASMTSAHSPALALTSAKSALLFGAGFLRARALFPALFALTTSAFTSILRPFSVSIFF
jgi:secreted Zn-dependent insulinase-like peptidase